MVWGNRLGKARNALSAILQHAACDSWLKFDLAAACYLELMNHISSEAEFIAVYNMHDGVKSNPNLPAIERLVSELSQLFVRTKENPMTAAELYGAIEEACAGLSLAPYEEEAKNEAMLLWAVILAVDDSCQYDRFWDTADYIIPMNEVAFVDEVGVYPNAQIGRAVPSFFSASRVGRIPESNLNGQLSQIFFLKKTDCMALPRIVTLLSPGQASGIPFDSLRVGLELFSGGVIADWSPTDKPIQLIHTKGNAFAITYDENYAERFAPLVRESIDHAIEAGCSILVFPEIVISPELREVIREHLRNKTFKGQLQLIVAGSAWEYVLDSTGGDNVCTLYGNDGTFLGRTYKQVPFIFQTTHDTGTVTYIESLANPAEERTVVDVAQLGRVVTAVCKDLVSDEREPVDLVRDVKADMVIVPAMSDSIDRAFSAHLRLIAERSLALSYLCNYCGACKTYPSKYEGPSALTEVSCACAPMAPSDGNPKQAKPLLVKLCRTAGNQNACAKQLEEGVPKSCLRVLELSKSVDEKGAVVGWQFFEDSSSGFSLCAGECVDEQLSAG